MYTEVITRAPCVVRQKGEDTRAWFHTWEHYAKPIDPSPVRGGHPGGQYSQVFGLVEFEDGTIHRVEPTNIIFTKPR